MSSLSASYLATGTALLPRVCAQHAPVLDKLGAIIGESIPHGGVPGAAITRMADGVTAGPTSTRTGAALLNLRSLEFVEWLQARGHPLPLLRSRNLPGAIESNRSLGARGRLSRQLA